MEKEELKSGDVFDIVFSTNDGEVHKEVGEIFGERPQHDGMVAGNVPLSLEYGIERAITRHPWKKKS